MRELYRQQIAQVYKTVLTINADRTYLLKQDYIDKKDGYDEANGIFKVLDGKVLMLVRLSTCEQTFYQFKDAKSIIMTDSMGVDLKVRLQNCMYSKG